LIPRIESLPLDKALCQAQGHRGVIRPLSWLEVKGPATYHVRHGLLAAHCELDRGTECVAAGEPQHTAAVPFAESRPVEFGPLTHHILLGWNLRGASPSLGRGVHQRLYPGQRLVGAHAVSHEPAAHHSARPSDPADTVHVYAAALGQGLVHGVQHIGHERRGRRTHIADRPVEVLGAAPKSSRLLSEDLRIGPRLLRGLRQIDEEVGASLQQSAQRGSGQRAIPVARVLAGEQPPRQDPVGRRDRSRRSIASQYRGRIAPAL